MKPDDYIRGARHGREAHDLELEAMRDPLLGDALDGFDAAPGDHSAALDRIAERIGKSAATGRAAIRSRRERGRERRVRNWSVAAAAVFIIGMVGGGLYLIREGVPGDTTRSTLAHETGTPGRIVPDEEVAILPPVTIIKEEKTVPAAEATDLSTLKLDRDEVRGFGEVAGSEIATLTPAEVQEFTKEWNELADDTVTTQDQITSQDQEVSQKQDVAQDHVTTTPVRIRGMSTAGMQQQSSVAPTPETRAVRGRVVDASTGEALAGVYVGNGEKAGAFTDADGRFELPDVSQQEKVEAHYLGYKSADVPTGVDDKEVLIAMNEDSAALEDVVVVGYGVQRRSTVTGSVSTAKDTGRAARKAASATGTTSVSDADTVITAQFRAFASANRAEQAGNHHTAQRDRVTISFEVSAEGRPRNIKIVESSSPAAARAARNLLRKGPDWPAEPSRKLIIINL